MALTAGPPPENQLIKQTAARRGNRTHVKGANQQMRDEALSACDDLSRNCVPNDPNSLEKVKHHKLCVTPFRRPLDWLNY